MLSNVHSVDYGKVCVQKVWKNKSLIRFLYVWVAAAISVYQLIAQHLFVFPPQLTLTWLPLRAGAEVSSHGVMPSHGLGHTSFPPAAGVAKALSTHSHHRGGSPLKERRKAEKGGHCGM